ncbi:MAG: proline racemase family protein [Bacteroidales bacterium]
MSKSPSKTLTDYFNRLSGRNNPLPENSIGTIDMHTGGEPLRIICCGVPEPEGKTILEKRAFMKNRMDLVRKQLMWEPRGHADMYGVMLTTPERENSAFGAIFMHNEGYSTMCGHATLALARFAIDSGLVEVSLPVTQFHVDVPAGQLTVFARFNNKNRLKEVSFRNVPSFVYRKDLIIEHPQYGSFTAEIAFGGAFYAFCPSSVVGKPMTPEYAREFINAGNSIKNYISERYEIVHPAAGDLSFLYGVIFTGPPVQKGNHSRNVCIFANGELDRSPTGSGVSARAALIYPDNPSIAQTPITIESIIGSEMKVKVVSETTFHNYRAVIPEVYGFPFYSGVHTFFTEEGDTLKEGFFIR